MFSIKCEYLTVPGMERGNPLQTRFDFVVISRRKCKFQIPISISNASLGLAASRVSISDDVSRLGSDLPPPPPISLLPTSLSLSSFSFGSFGLVTFAKPKQIAKIYANRNTQNTYANTKQSRQGRSKGGGRGRGAGGKAAHQRVSWACFDLRFI